MNKLFMRLSLTEDDRLSIKKWLNDAITAGNTVILADPESLQEVRKETVLVVTVGPTATDKLEPIRHKNITIYEKEVWNVDVTYKDYYITMDDAKKILEEE